MYTQHKGWSTGTVLLSVLLDQFEIIKKGDMFGQKMDILHEMNEVWET